MTTKGVNIQMGARWDGGPAVNRLRKDLVGTRRELDLASVAGRRFSEKLGGSTWRRQVQQAGMQISDFSIQVAGGQSAILAFTQQAPQFIQNFGAMGGVVAAAVTILGTFWYAASRATGAAKEFSVQVEETSSAIESYISAVRSGNGIESQLFRDRENVLKTTSETAKILREIERSKAYRSVRLLGESLSDANTEASIWRKLRLGTDIGLAGDLLNINTLLSGNITIWKDSRKEVQNFIDTVRGISTGSSLDEMYSSAIKAREIFRENVNVTGEMTRSQREFWEQLNQNIQQLELLGAVQASSADSNAAMINRQMTAYQQYNRSRVIGEQLLAEAQAVAINEQMIATQTAHQQSIRLAKEFADKSKAAYREYYQSRVAGAAMAARNDVVMYRKAQAAYVQYYRSRIQGEADVAKERAKAAASITMLDLAGQYAAYGAGQQAQREAEAAQRYSVSGRAFELPGITSGGRGGLSRSGGRGGLSRSGGGGGGISDVEKFTERARRAYEETKRLTAGVLGIDDAWSKFTENLAKSKDMEGLTDQFIEKAREIKTTFEQLQNAVSSSMMSGFKGLLDGTKSLGDAARDILSSILDNIINILMTPVFNRIAGSITGGILGGLGGMGAAIPSFDGGGFTGHGPRAGGMDGKGGRLAMLHPNESIIDHRRGGGSGVTVNMTINTPNAESFMASRRQVERQIAVAARRGAT